MYESRRAALVLIAERLDVLNVDDFEDRLILQKSIYLLQELIGVDLGYRYSWYLRGPYCSAVAHDAFDAISSRSLGRIRKEYKLSREIITDVSRFEKRVLASKPGSIDRSTWLEVLSSLHYLKTDRLSKAVSKETAQAKLLEAKPFLREVPSFVVDRAWTILAEDASA